MSHGSFGDQKSNMSWIGKEESLRTVVRKGNFWHKTMVSIFSRTSGADQITYSDKSKAMDSESYINDWLNPLLSSLHHENKHFGIKKHKISA